MLIIIKGIIKMTVNREIRQDIEIYRIRGELSIRTMQDLFNVYDHAIKEGKYKFIFDLENVTYMDSSGIGTLLIGARSALKNKTTIKIIGISHNKQLKELFESAKINIGVTYHENLDEAIKSFN